MKKIILAVLALMLSCGVANAEISESVLGKHLNIASTTTAPFNNIFTCSIRFSSIKSTENLNYTLSASENEAPVYCHANPKFNYNLSIDLRHPQDNHELFFAKEPVLTLSDQVGTDGKQRSLAVPFKPTNASFIVWDTQNVTVTPNSDGSYSESRETRSGFSDANIYMSHPGFVPYDYTKFNYWYLFPAIQNGTSLSMTVTWYKTEVDAFKETNPQSTVLTIPAATIAEWKEVLHQAGYDIY